MPLYEYQCDACGNRFERIQKFSDPPADTCPACGGPVRKLVSSPAFQFKGTGWYVTDYARKSESSGGSSKSDEATKDSTPKEAPADASSGTKDTSKDATAEKKPAGPSAPTTKS